MSNDLPPAAGPVPPYGTPDSSSEAGPPGSSGPLGAPGPSGPSGVPDPSGPSGAPGPSDPSAPYGPSGSSSASGGPNPPLWNASRPPGRQHRYATDDFFAWIRGTGLTRVQEGRWAAGVAGGISRRWDIDPILVRGVLVAATLFGGAGILAYGLGWLLLPQESDGRIHLQRALHGDVSLGFIGSILLTLAGISGGGGGPWSHLWWGSGFPGGLVLTVAIIAAIWWFAKRHPNQPGSAYGSPLPGPPTETRPSAAGWTASSSYAPTEEVPRPDYGTQGYGTQAYGGQEYRGQDYLAQEYRQTQQLRQAQDQPPHSGRRPKPPRPPKRREVSRPSKRIVYSTLGVALIGSAAILLIGRNRDWTTPAGLSAAAVALLVISIGVLASGLTARRAGGLTAIGLILAFFTVCAAGAQNTGVRSDQNVSLAGVRTWAPTTPDAAARQFNQGFGEATLDLTRPGITAAATAATPLQVQARMAAGHLIVTLPENTPVEVQVRMVAGQVNNPNGQVIQVSGHQQSHLVDTVRTGAGSAPLLVLQVQQGFGELDLRTASTRASFTSPTAAVGATPTPVATPSNAPTPASTSSPAASATRIKVRTS